METVRTTLCNHDLGAPPGHEATTGALPCRVDRDDEYGLAFRSYWRPSAEEIGELARGGFIRLGVFGGAHPPVAMAIVPGGVRRGRRSTRAERLCGRAGDAVKRARREHEDREEPVDVQVLRQVTHTAFLVPDVIPRPDGSRVVSFVLPNGDALIFPLTGESSERVGRQLLAPSVQVAAPGDLPGGGNGGPPPARRG